ncbi:cysteine hydrolase [Brevibacillus sp. LEMMJ03]|uniref:cysteine hydrolase family protein n=1 Tax=Brevibacillus sp. LEMMJ03 TaxID=2595056 RepID=UPI00117C8B0E|nr:cysteine hydrolase family protein [Brevibacillus sp. LEMMJ03]TRY24330.1 cysteine hydrolase [Brevibacillus sp. LEMMJ03]
MSNKTALLIVDVQVFLIEHAYQGNEIVKRIANLLSRARVLEIPVLHVQHTGKVGGPFEEGTPSWLLHPSIVPADNEPIIRKTACDSFFQTSLQNELETKGINHLVIVGLQTEYCIDTTCRRAVSIGYDVTLVKDCHSTFDGEFLKADQIIAHHNSILDGFGTPNNQILVKESKSLFI